ncbi:hypothetical protein AB0M22_09160 [Nocardia sp. NPDC051756]|uniref:hypothetical protein n=1 Tax=Nocardia sp. NPDC051756 TaxID=3154751 RepID=UPI0034272584
MIKSWIDAETGVKHYADEHSKAYRKREERERAGEPTEVAAPTETASEAPAEVTVKRPRRGEDSPS